MADAKIFLVDVEQVSAETAACRVDGFLAFHIQFFQFEETISFLHEGDFVVQLRNDLQLGLDATFEISLRGLVLLVRLFQLLDVLVKEGIFLLKFLERNQVFVEAGQFESLYGDLLLLFEGPDVLLGFVQIVFELKDGHAVRFLQRARGAQLLL